MARSYATDVLLDSAGNAIASARGLLYTNAAATTPVADAYAASAGGSPITYVTTDTSGKWECYFTSPKAFYIKWTDNSNTAYPINSPATRLDFTDFVSARKDAREDPADELTDDASLASVVAGLAAHLADATDAHDASAVSETTYGDVQTAVGKLKTTLGTWDAMQLVVPVDGQRWYATDQGVDYKGVSGVWVRTTGNPKDIWVTDYGWKCDNNTASAAGNVTAYNAALAAARAAASSSTGGHKTIYIPEAPGFTTAYVNATLNFEHVTVVGIGGSHRPGSFSYDNMVRVSWTGTTDGAVFEVSAAVAGVHGGSLKNLRVTGYNKAVRIRNSDVVLLDNVDLTISTTALARNHCLEIENSFWLNVRQFALHTANDVDRYTIGIYATDGGPIYGLAEAFFDDGVLDFGGIYLENQATSAGSSVLGNVQWKNVTSENQGTAYPFMTVRNTGTAAIGLDGWRFIHCAQFDQGGGSGGSGAAFDFSSGGFIGFTRWYVTGMGGTYLIRTISHVSCGGWVIESLGAAQTLFDPASTTTNVYGMKVGDISGGGHAVRGNMAATAAASQWSSGIADAGYRVGKAIGDTHARGMWRSSDGALSAGSGSAVHDVYLRRSAASTWTMDADGAGAAATLVVNTATLTTASATTLTGTTATYTTLVGTGSVRAGTTVAGSGAVRLANDGRVTARNVANSADIDLLYLSTGNTTILSGAAMSLLSSGSVNIAPGNVTKLAVGTTALTVSDAYDVVLNGTTGTKWATAASQKQAWWGATPIVQPTTAFAAATLVGGGGTALTDTDTFDGYTLKQVVKALRSMGKLA